MMRWCLNDASTGVPAPAPSPMVVAAADDDDDDTYEPWFPLYSRGNECAR